MQYSDISHLFFILLKQVIQSLQNMLESNVTYQRGLLKTKIIVKEQTKSPKNWMKSNSQKT